MESSVLLIEDDVVLAENTRELLELSGYRTLTSHDGKSGLKKAFQEKPDLIISDIMMPELDGYEVYKALQQSQVTCNIPFIFLSAKADPGDIRKGMNLGADDYLTKPFNEEDLILAIERRLEKRCQLLQQERKEVQPGKKGQALEELKEHFKSCGEQLNAEKHEDIYLEGRLAGNIFLLESGLVKTSRLDELGKELITGILQKGEFFGFYSFQPHSCYPETATTLEKSVLFRASHDEFVQMLEQNLELTLEYAELISQHLDVLKTHLLEMAYGSVLKKTASTLLEFAKKTGLGNSQLIKVSRSDMASVAGISTESFIRSLSSLRADGIIDILGRDIKILDLQKLQNIH
ncbi:response regulator [Salinimicrobium oceani]|uniref:Response regulator n=1 Tax=Salinimicrobium oceani TaxID=2722702 RepID=A0ABX1D046_9FLAO|nr:response regulator [Salinimicrobium oceani]NJW52528.1 response regulator [Salinimicrobium oceani]